MKTTENITGMKAFIQMRIEHQKMAVLYTDENNIETLMDELVLLAKYEKLLLSLGE